MAIRRLFRSAPDVADQGWLVRDDRVLCSFEAPPGKRGQAKGLLGRDGLEGAMVLPTRSVHSFGMRFDLEVAFVDADGVVLRMQKLAKNRVTRPVLDAAWVIEVEPGCFTRWGLCEGDQLEFRAAGADGPAAT